MTTPTWLPRIKGEHRHRIGARTLDPARWIDLGDGADEQLAEKQILLDERPGDIVQALDDPAVVAASVELFQLLTAHLAGHFPDRPIPVAPAGLHPIDAAGRLVPEDLCLHLPDTAGRLVLVAASLAFPFRWVLAEKLGLPMDRIHEPIPRYPEQIGVGVDQLMEKLTPERGLWRENFSVLDHPALFQPVRPPRSEQVPVPGGFFLRSEYQTLRRLPGSGAVVFTIRTRVHALADVGGDRVACRTVADYLRGLSPEIVVYRELTEDRDRLLAWLDPRS